MINNQVKQKRLLNFETYARQAPHSTKGQAKPTGSDVELKKIVSDFLTPAGDQTAFVLWARTNVTMNQLELGLMVINFRKTKVEGKKGKTAAEWEKVVKRISDEYDKATMSVKPPFNERVVVREMCFKYGIYLRSQYFGKKGKDYLKFCASKCAVYICGVGWLMSTLEEQIEEMKNYMLGNKGLDDFDHRRPINVIELTRLENEKEDEADLEGILAWLMVVMEPIMTVTLETEVDYIEEIKAIQTAWHEMWEDVINGKSKKIGKKQDVESRINSYKQSMSPSVGSNGGSTGGNNNSSTNNTNQVISNNNNNNMQNISGGTGTTIGTVPNMMQQVNKKTSKKKSK